MTRNCGNRAWLGETGLLISTGKPTETATVKRFDKAHGLPWASAEMFPGWGNLNILLILFMLLTMQCKCTFIKRFILSSPKRKYPMLRLQSQKSRFVGAAMLLFHSCFSRSTKLRSLPLSAVTVSQHFLPKMFAFNNHICGKTSTTITWSEPLKIGCHVICYGKFLFNFKLFRSVLALSVAVVSALSARRLTWLPRFVCVLAVCGGQVVREWLRMEACILRFNRRRQRRSDLGFFVSYMWSFFWLTTRVVPLYCV